MMARWVPAVATIGLACVMILPAPGILGVLIGGLCVVAIAVSALMYLLDRMSSRILAWHEDLRARRPMKRRRTVHAGSGIAKKI